MMKQAMLEHLNEMPLLPGPFRSQCGAVTGFDVSDEIKSINVPTMVLVGKNDILTPPAFSEEIAGKIPGSFLNIIEGGHAYNQEAPAAFNRALMEFFGRN
jgi:pimeloyl-ACP methyl ester carboxylesterase